MRRRLSIVGLVALLLIAAVGASLLVPRTSFYPYVVFQSGDSLRLVFLQQARRLEADCRASRARMVQAVLAECPACRLLENRCLDRLDTRQRKILTGQPVDVPIMQVPGGAVAFISGTPDLASDVCRDAARQASKKLPAQCETAGPDDIGFALAKISAVSNAAAMPEAAERIAMTLIAAFLSFLACYLIIRSERLHGHFTHDPTRTGPQKFHATPTPRIGGLGIAAGLWGSIIAVEVLDWLDPVPAYGLAMLALAAIPAFAGGFAEDVTKRVGVIARLMLTIAAGVFASLLVGATLDRLDVPLLDNLFQWPLFAIAFTAFAVGGVANAINIIDGYNGLAGGYSIIVLFALAWVAGLVGDPIVLIASLAMIGGLLGFLCWNYPTGRIFMGDGGAYLTGFWLAELAVLLVVRNPDVSPWFPLVLLAYPIWETFFSVFRKKYLRGLSPGVPDGLHFHMLIFRRLARIGIGSGNRRDRIRRNSAVSFYVWIGAILYVIPATLVWNRTPLLITIAALFAIAYVWLYLRLTRWRAPKWMILRERLADTRRTVDPKR